MIKFKYDDSVAKIKIEGYPRWIDVGFYPGDLGVSRREMPEFPEFEADIVEFPKATRYKRDELLSYAMPGIGKMHAFETSPGKDLHIDVCEKWLRKLFGKIPNALWLRRVK